MKNLRTCIGCGCRLPAGQMLRIVCNHNTLAADIRHMLPGRGGYFCGQAACGERLKRGRFKARPPGDCRDSAIWNKFMVRISGANVD